MTGKSCEKKHDNFLKVPIENAGTKNKKLKIDKKNPFAGDFF